MGTMKHLGEERMAHFFWWEAKYSVDISSVDDQHRGLIGLMNDLFNAMMKDRSDRVMADVLTALVEYAGTHFQHEEQLMQDHGYPDLAAHQQEHETFTTRFRDLKGRHDAGEAGIPAAETAEFLRDWLAHHILGTDQRYGPFLKERGVR